MPRKTADQKFLKTLRLVSNTNASFYRHKNTYCAKAAFGRAFGVELPDQTKLVGLPYGSTLRHEFDEAMCKLDHFLGSVSWEIRVELNKLENRIFHMQRRGLRDAVIKVINKYERMNRPSAKKKAQVTA